MAMRNPVGRANYQPNSHGEGPRESPTSRLSASSRRGTGTEGAARPESFAGSLQPSKAPLLARPARNSVTSPSALTFELSKVEIPAIRERMVSHPSEHR